MGGRRPAGAESVDVPESNTLLLMPRISLSAAVRDRITGANGLIPSNGFPLGHQLETAKAGHLPPQLTCRGIDQKICKQLLYLRYPFTVSCVLNSSRSAHSNGRLKGPCAATIPDECRTTTRSTSIIPTGNGYPRLETSESVKLSEFLELGFPPKENWRRRLGP